MQGPAQDESREILVAALGAAEAAALLDQLDNHGLVAVRASTLEQLELESARYRRLAALVDEPDQRSH